MGVAGQRQQLPGVKLTGYTGEDNRLAYNGDTPGHYDSWEGWSWVNYEEPWSKEVGRNALDAAWSLFADGLFTSNDSHDFKFGLTYETMTSKYVTEMAGGFSYYDDSWYCDSSDAYFADPLCGVYSSNWGGEWNLDAEMDGFHVYAQDSWKTGRVTVNYGVRYTKYTGDFADPVSAPTSGGSHVYDASMWAPRLGLVWDITGQGKTAFKFHYGIYYDGMSVVLYDREASGDAVSDTLYYDYNFDTGEFDIPAGGSVNAYADMDPGINHPNVEQFVFTFEHQLMDELLIGIDYIQRENKDIAAMVTSNVGDYDPQIAPDNPSRRRRLAVLRSPRRRQEFFITNPEDATRDYDSVALRLQKRYSEALVPRCVPGVVRPDRQRRLGPNGYVDEFEDLNGLVNADGMLPCNSEWVFKLSGSVDLPLNFMLSGFYQYQTGEYWTPYVRMRDLYYNDRTTVFMTDRGAASSIRTADSRPPPRIRPRARRASGTRPHRRCLQRSRFGQGDQCLAALGRLFLRLSGSPGGQRVGADVVVRNADIDSEAAGDSVRRQVQLLIALVPGRPSGRPLFVGPGGTCCDEQRLVLALLSRGAGFRLAGGQPRGHLVLNGGGANPRVMEKFVELAGGPEALIVVFPTASEMLDTGEYYRESLWRSTGAPTSSSPEIRTRDQALERRNRRALVKVPEGSFFPAGDQRRITEALLGTPVGDAVEKAYLGGQLSVELPPAPPARVGLMITGDGDFTVLTAGNVELWDGFGFFQGVIVDQHFVARQRQNRLISVVLEHPELLGVGVDEGTAVWVRPDGSFKVLGDGWVIVFDASIGDSQSSGARRGGNNARGPRSRDSHSASGRDLRSLDHEGSSVRTPASESSPPGFRCDCSQAAATISRGSVRHLFGERRCSRASTKLPNASGQNSSLSVCCRKSMRRTGADGTGLPVLIARDEGATGSHHALDRSYGHGPCRRSHRGWSAAALRARGRWI